MIFPNHNQLLFSQGDIGELLRRLCEDIKSRVDAIPEDQFLASSEDDLRNHIKGYVSIDHIILHEDKMVMERRENPVDVSDDPMRFPRRNGGPLYVEGIRMTFTIPFTGDSRLWSLRLSPFQPVFPRGHVRHPSSDGIGYIDIIIDSPNDEKPQRIRKVLDDNLDRIRSCLSKQQEQVQRHNESLDNLVSQAIQHRRQKLATQDEMVQALNIPLRRKDGAPEISNIPIRRRLIRPLPPPPKSGFKPEPGIAQDVYEHILSVIRHEGRTYEATPRTFSVHDEEELRDILLAHLNGHYQGDATGETFRKLGKTDIRIEDENRAAFVAECKVWRGPEKLVEAIDQLLGYLTWRDCKAAIVIFNKHNARFTELLEKVPAVFTAHPLLKQDLGPQGAGEWRYVLISDEDELRYIHVHVFLFNLYVPPPGWQARSHQDPQ